MHEKCKAPGRQGPCNVILSKSEIYESNRNSIHYYVGLTRVCSELVGFTRVRSQTRRCSRNGDYTVNVACRIYKTTLTDRISNKREPVGLQRSEMAAVDWMYNGLQWIRAVQDAIDHKQRVRSTAAKISIGENQRVSCYRGALHVSDRCDSFAS